MCINRKPYSFLEVLSTDKGRGMTLKDILKGACIEVRERTGDAVFRKLCDLCVTMTPEELCEDAELDETGRILRVEIPWDRQGHKKMSGMPKTVLGRIVIDEQRLTAEVNSAERAETLRREIDARLGGDGRFKVDEIQDFDAMMSRDAAESDESTPSSTHEELMQYPEVQAQMAEMFARHWES